MSTAQATGASTILQAGEVRSARVESLRALAALGVLVGHIYGSAHAYDPSVVLDDLLSRTILGGGFGVFLFFALSGYLLFWPMARSRFRPDGGGIDLGRYAANRALRILPLYWVSVVVVLALTGAGAGTWAIFLGFAENFTPGTVGANPYNGVLWSVVVEIHFYVLLPLIAIALAGLTRRRIVPALVLLIVAGAASAALRWYGTAVAPNPFIEFNLPGTFVFFVPGMALALLRVAWEKAPPRWLAGPLGNGDLWLLAAAALWLVQFYRYPWFPATLAATFLMVGACVLPGIRAGVLLRSLSLRALALVGVASYSLYIWHVPLLAWLTGGVAPDYGFPGLLAIALPACLAIAFVSYAAIERPFLRLRRRWAAAAAAHRPTSAHAHKPTSATVA